MLPTRSSGRGPRGPPPPRWRRPVLAALALSFGLFVWMQYTIVTTQLGEAPATVAQLQGATRQDVGAVPEHLRHPAGAELKAEVAKVSTPEPQVEAQWDEDDPPADVAAADDAPAEGGEPGPVHLRGDAEKQALVHKVEEEFDPQEGVATVMQPPPEANTPANNQVNNQANDQAKRRPLSIAEQDERRLAVRAAMQFAWENYEEHAFGGDEVDPKNGVKLANVWGNIACSLVDGMDTLYVMGLTDEFARAREYVAKHLRFDHLGADGSSLSVFETIIREVGGLLSAYDLSGDAVFKDKAVELADLLTPAFDEDEGVFYTIFNPLTKAKSFAAWAGYQAHIADVGTLQLEMRYLSDITGDPKYAKMGDAFYAILRREGSFKNTGLFPVHFDPTHGKFNTRSSTITLGALGDSFYEYLLKVFIYSGARAEDAFLRELYDDAVRGIEEHLLVYSERDELFFLQELKVPSFSGIRRMDHLLCFVPGLLALGTLAETQDTKKNERHLGIAKQLMETCYQMYHRQPTGLSPDIVSFPGMNVYDGKYRLRPETVESLFYLYRVTKDQKYRDYGWEIFQAIERHARTEHGYGAVLNVEELPARTENKMESFFLAETLKYHYLLQGPDDLIPLDEYVFNTEAHPLRIRKSTAAA